MTQMKMAPFPIHTRPEKKLTIRFAEELDFFLARQNRRIPLFCDVRRRASVKDIIESFGVPHTEIMEILFNGVPVDFSFIPEHGGQLISAGIEPPFDVTARHLLRQSPLARLKFIADLNVMKLGRYLLLLGFDVCLARQLTDAQIAAAAKKEQRIVLTRDTRLLCRKKIEFARRIRTSQPMDQLKETIEFFGLSPDPDLFFTRCSACNMVLEPVTKLSVYHRLEPKTQKYFHHFRECPDCGHIFWKGSHYDAILHRFRAAGILEIH